MNVVFQADPSELRRQAEVHAQAIDQIKAARADIERMTSEAQTLGPLYHQVVAAVSAPLDLTQSETQFVASFFAAALAAVVVWFALPITDPVLRWLVVAPLLLSPYFWQSALWMLNDDAGLLFGLIALIAVLRQRESGSGYTQLGIGLLIAAAIATRQSYIWLVVPATCATLVAMPGGSKGGKIAAALRLAGPGVAVLTVLALLWRGFSPPLTQEMNASRLSWVSLSYCFAVGALFFVPVAIAVWDRRPRRPLAAYVLPVAAALPALVFESAATTPPDNSRRGSLIWTLVAHTPTIFGRSPFLAILAFVGALAACLPTMVANLTLGRKKYAAAEGAMVDLKREAEELRRELLALGRRDSEAFDQVLRARRLAQSTPAEIDEREQAMTRADLEACRVPLETARACARVAALAAVAASQGNVNACSDAGVAGLLARAAGEGALLNVQINLKSLPASADKDHVSSQAESVRTELQAASDRCTAAVQAAMNA